jgi:uncharacterized protein (DUF952 family)
MSAHPQYVYRLATRAEWRAAEDTGVVPTRDIDKRDGYVHLSTGDQVLETANLHFRGEAALLALEIALSTIGDEVKFEPAPKRGEDFPHLYGALRACHVARAIRLQETESGFAFGDPL